MICSKAINRKPIPSASQAHKITLLIEMNQLILNCICFNTNDLIVNDFLSASSFDPSEQSGVSRSSDILDTFNTSNRKGYEVKEDVDEPPFDYRSMPVVGSAPNQYQSVSTAALTKNLYVSN